MRPIRTALLAGLLGAVSAGARAQCVFTLQAPVTYFSAGFTSDIALTDLNGDGHPDMVYSDFLSPYLNTRLNSGDGTFGPRSYLDMPSASDSVAAGDLNGDGFADAVVDLVDSIGICLGRGDGTFAPPVTHPAGDGAAAVALADLDEDGRLDVIVANYGGSTVTVMRGNGDGTLLDATHYTVGGAPFSLRVRDLDGDGILDIVTADSDGSISLLWGNGNAGFDTPIVMPVGEEPYSIDAGDINHDGLPDLVLADYAANSAHVFLNQSGRSFAHAGELPSGLSPWKVRIAEVNGDGNPDIVVVAQTLAAMLVLTGDGNGGFAPEHLAPSNGLPWALSVGDLNGDDRIDIVAADGPVRVWLNSSSDYLPPTILEQPVGLVVDAGQPAALTVAASTASGLPISYQWRRDGVPLADGGSISGAQTTDLLINPAGPGDAAVYDCVVSLPACDGSTLDTISMPAAIGIKGTNCPGDFNGDGTVNTLDVIGFLNAWTAGC